MHVAKTPRIGFLQANLAAGWVMGWEVVAVDIKLGGSVIWCRGDRGIEMESVKEKLRKRVAKRGGQCQPVG